MQSCCVDTPAPVSVLLHSQARCTAGLYDWPPFVIAPGFSVVGTLLMAGLENLVGFQLLGQYDLDDVAADAHAGETEGLCNANPIYDPVKPPKVADEEGVYAKSMEK